MNGSPLQAWDSQQVWLTLHVVVLATEVVHPFGVHPHILVLNDGMVHTLVVILSTRSGSHPDLDGTT